VWVGGDLGFLGRKEVGGCDCFMYRVVCFGRLLWAVVVFLILNPLGGLVKRIYIRIQGVRSINS